MPYSPLLPYSCWCQFEALASFPVKILVAPLQMWLFVSFSLPQDSCIFSAKSSPRAHQLTGHVGGSPPSPGAHGTGCCCVYVCAPGVLFSALNHRCVTKRRRKRRRKRKANNLSSCDYSSFGLRARAGLCILRVLRGPEIYFISGQDVYKNNPYSSWYYSK